MPQHWGIYNSVAKRFVYGIDKPTKVEAWNEFCKKYPRKYIPYRYGVRLIPKNWINKPNAFYETSKIVVYNRQEKGQIRR